METSQSKYTILRESACGERIFYLYHRLGIQSNVVVAAKYANHAHILTKPTVLRALKTVVEAHPMMRVVGIREPSRRKRGRHTLQLAMLHEIDLETCVEFVSHADHRTTMPAVIEQAHNEWDHMDDIPERPLFKLIVVNQTDVVLVYHHMMADGMSGYVFHREFLEALNAATMSPESADSCHIVYSEPSRVKLPLEWSQMSNRHNSKDKRWHPSTLEIVLSQSRFLLSQLLWSSRFIFSKLPSSRPHLRSVTEIADEHQRTVTGVVSARLTKHQVSKVLQACRKNGTTLTPLLITMLLIVFSTEYNTTAKIGSTRFALDMRPHVPFPPQEFGGETKHGIMFNCTSGMARASRLKRYRSIIKDFHDDTGSIEKGHSDIDHEAVWEVTRRYKQWMNDSTDPAIRAVRASKGMSTELEHILNRLMPFAGTILTSTTLVSNLGVFAPGESNAADGERADKWNITDIHFSAAASNGAQGSQGPIFNVSGLKGGDTNINAVFEEGIIDRSEVQRLLDTTVAKLVALAL